MLIILIIKLPSIKYKPKSHNINKHKNIYSLKNNHSSNINNK